MFLFRLIQALITDQEYFETFKYYDTRETVLKEFKAQFEKEWLMDFTIFVSEAPFDYDLQWNDILGSLRLLELENPILEHAWPILYTN